MTHEQLERLVDLMDQQMNEQTAFIAKVTQAKKDLNTLSQELENVMARISEFTC